jgi:hypothetical protein
MLGWIVTLRWVHLDPDQRPRVHGLIALCKGAVDLGQPAGGSVAQVRSRPPGQAAQASAHPGDEPSPVNFEHPDIYISPILGEQAGKSLDFSRPATRPNTVIRQRLKRHLLAAFNIRKQDHGKASAQNKVFDFLYLD